MNRIFLTKSIKTKTIRHCERSEAIQRGGCQWIASGYRPRNDVLYAITRNLLIAAYFTLASPFLGWGQGQSSCSVLELTQPNTSGTYSSREMVKMTNGFSSNPYFRAYVDETMICDMEYQDPIDPNRPVNTDKPVGAIAGVVDVSPTGAATYQIPIFTPPGTAGMEPQISIVYNSQSGNGMLGMGWDIAGLSAITRAGQTIYHDEKETYVGLTNNDRFLLDGNRLIVTNNVTYGAIGAVYGTERETYSRITSKETVGSGPKWFEVVTKEGMIVEYGNTTDSRITVGTEVFQWRINKITDDNGNYMQYTYKNNGDGELRIEKIEYTGTATGQAPYNTITFLYSKRTDVWREYISTKSVFYEHILRGIKIESNGEAVRKYWFKYNYDGFASYLVEVIEEGSDGEQLNSTIINRAKDNFTDDTRKFEVPYSYQNRPKQIYAADITGNGKKDLLVTHEISTTGGYGPSCEVFFMDESDNIQRMPENTASVFRISGITDKPFQGNQICLNDDRCDKWYRGECITSPDRDGKQHVFFIFCNKYEETDTTWTHYIYDCKMSDLGYGPKFYYMPPIEYTCNRKYDIRIITGDFYGDGSIPYFLMQTQIKDDSGNELKDQPYDVVPEFTQDLPEDKLIDNLNGAKDILIYDMEGNGKSTLIKLDNNGESSFYTFNKNNGTYSMDLQYSYPSLLDDKSLMGDFNGDGKVDVLNKISLLITNVYALSMNTGNDFITVFTDIPVQQGDSAIYVGDFNGDGRSDVFIPNHDAIYLNQGYKPVLNGLISFPIDLSGYYHFKEHTIPGFSYHADSAYQFQIADYNGDGKESIVYSNSNYGRLAMYSLSPKIYSPLVTNITDGLNNPIRFEYDAILHRQIYEQGSEPPENDVTISKKNLYVVSKLTAKNGIGGDNPITFFYKDARAHNPSRRLMGFTSIIATDATKNIKYTNNFKYDTVFFSVYLAGTYLTLASDDDPVSSMTYTNYAQNMGNKRFFPCTTKRSETYHPSNIEYSDSFQYDFVNGNVIRMSTNRSVSVIDTFVYVKKGNSVYKNKLERHESRWFYNNTPYRTTDYVYDGKGNLLKTTTNAGVVTDYLVNAMGLVTQQTVSAPQEETLVSKFGYDNKNRYVEKITITGLGSSSYTYNNSGNLLSETGVNNLTTWYRYDGFGRVNAVKYPEGYFSTITCDWIQGNNDKLRFSTETVTQGSPTVKTNYDILGREVQSQTDGFNGTVFVDTEYNNKGQTVKTSYPYYAQETKKWIQTYYDAYGRIDTISDNGLKTTYSYKKTTYTATTTIETPDKKTRSITTNSAGNIIEYSDAGGKIVYQYHSSGQPKTITVNDDVIFKMTYDKFGRQDTLVDPNAGTIVYKYTPFGEVNYMKDARENVTTYKYDFLRRLKTETSPDDNITYKYYTSGANIGQLESITGNNQKKINYEYDSYGRAVKVTEYALTTQYEYNQYGQKTAIVYPAGFKINRTYNSKGYLTEIRNTANNQLIWQRNEETALGQPKKYTLGNGKTVTFEYDNYNYLASIKTPDVQASTYDFDQKTGNLSALMEKVFNINDYNAEIFGYDKLDRLDSIERFSMQHLPLVTIKYLDNGNIDYKSDVGTYGYDPHQPHAVKQITNPDLSIELFNSGAQDIQYNSYQKAFSIEGESGYKMNIQYGLDQQRMKTELLYQNALQKTKYLATNYEKTVDHTTGKTRHINYISTPYGAVAAHIQENNSAQTYYLHKDHLGSINTITNQSGAVVERRSFDAWGRPRHPDNWGYDNIPPMAILDRGYTAHEHLPEFNLINMGGRMYDPVIARFLSVDPYVQNVGTQGFNRYSYCFNNPLKYIDPTGEVASYNNDPPNGWTSPIDNDRWSCDICPIIVSSSPNGGDRYTSSISTFDTNMTALSSGSVYMPSVSGTDPSLAYVTQWVGDGNMGRNNGGYSNGGGGGNSNGSSGNYSQGKGGGGGSGSNYGSGGGSSKGGNAPALRNGVSLQGAMMMEQLYWHFQFGRGTNFPINASALDFSMTSREALGIPANLKAGDTWLVNLFKTGINELSLSFGKVYMVYHGNDQFSILPNAFDFDHKTPEEGGTFSRNAATFIGGTIFGRVYNYRIPNPINPVVQPNFFFGGPFNVVFNGKITIR